ncbi:hypothetical protein AB4Y90_00380 [Chryseobacterium sp. 2TAF14]|uniref:hypothetical protein n=1 Tax=Chryseobacterium sp. 2TAF14 TaxID=3233007 RepID=UPI003F8E06A8
MGSTLASIDESIRIVHSIAVDANYFNEIIYRIHEDVRFIITPFYSHFHPKYEVEVTNYNLNLYKFLLKNEKLLVEILYNEEYMNRFIDGKNKFKDKWSHLNPHNFKTWNTLLHLFKTRKLTEILSKQEVFTKDEILKSFEHSGFLHEYLEFEESYSLSVLSYLSLRNSQLNNFSEFKIPISSYYSYNLPPAESEEVTIDVKVEFIILNETRQLDQYKGTSTNSELADIVSRIINNKYKKFKVKNPCTKNNIKNILTADNYFPDYTLSQSAYKKSNVKKAIKLLTEMNFPLTRCKYLPQLRLKEPSWFD